MNDHENPTGTTAADGATRGRIDLTALILALLLLGVAAIGLSGETWWLIPNLMPWLIAGAVALVGLGLIVSTLPRRHRGERKS